MKLKTGPPYTEDKRRLKEEENHATLVGGRFNEQRNLHEACQGSPKRIRYSYTPARILKPQREDLTEFSHLSGPDSLRTIQCSLKDATSEASPTVWEQWAECTFQDRRVRSL